MATNNGKVHTLLSAVEATGAGTGVKSEVLGSVSYQCKGITTATVALQASIDGTNYETVASMTADGVASVAGPFKMIRANVTAWTSGAITVTALA
jgi:hypothetical protein